jgi:predicted outer membrane repeat protein
MGFSSWLGKRQGSARRRRGSPRAWPRYRPRLEALEDRWLPSQVSLTVTSLADSGSGTLRDAVLTADAGKRSDQFTIGFAVTGTIDLHTPLPDLNDSIAIQGPGASSLTVERAAGFSFASAIVTVDSGQTATLSGLTIANGNQGGIANHGSLTVVNSAVVNNSVFGNIDGSLGEGGGVFNAGTLTVSGSTVSCNSASGIFVGGVFDGAGGGIFNEGTLTVTSSTLSDNSAGAAGGGIDNEFTETFTGTTPVFTGGNLTVTASTLCGNAAGNGGGGIATGGHTATVSGCTLSGNNARDGGGIWNGTNLTVTGSSLSGNSALGLSGNPDITPSGGGIFNVEGTLTVSGATLSGNTSRYGGGIYSAGSTTISGCTVFGNSAPGFTSETGFHVAGAGAGIDVVGSFTVSGSTLYCNSTDGGGGGMSASGAQGSTITGCTLWGNSAFWGGGIDQLGFTAISNSTLYCNTALGGGGAMRLGGPATVSGCAFWGNSAIGFTFPGFPVFHIPGSGGAIEAQWPDNAVRDSTFTSNSAERGGAIYSPGGLTVSGCTFTSNSATQGGGIYEDDFGGTLTVRDSTFTGNTASDSGGGLYNIGTATLLNCSLSKNTAGSAGGGIFNAAVGTLVVKDSTVLNNVAPFGADIYNLGALTLNDSTVGVIGP